MFKLRCKIETLSKNRESSYVSATINPFSFTYLEHIIANTEKYPCLQLSLNLMAAHPIGDQTNERQTEYSTPFLYNINRIWDLIIQNQSEIMKKASNTFAAFIVQSNKFISRFLD